MAIRKRIVVLANSYKGGRENHCVAGRELLSDCFGSWLRPDMNGSGAVPQRQRTYVTGREPGIGDVILLSVLNPMNRSDHQRENWRLDSTVRWHWVTTVGWAQLAQLDEGDAELWPDSGAGDSRYGVNNRVRSSQAARFDSSMRLIRVPRLRISVTELEHRDYPRIDGEFHLGGVSYRLSVTDPVLLDRFGWEPAGIMIWVIVCSRLASVSRSPGSVTNSLRVS